MRAHVASDLKEHNRKLVFDLIRSKGVISKAEIGRRSGISAPTVMKIVDYFAALGIVGEGGEGAATLGRKPMLISFEQDSAFALGAEYDGVHLSVGLVDLGGEIRALRRAVAPPELRELVGSFLPREAEKLIAEASIPSSLLRGIGIGMPGVVDDSKRLLLQAPLVGMGGSADYGSLLARLEDRLGLPAIAANDANAAALGENAARGPGGDLVFVSLGRGLGAGIVLDGKLRQGPRCRAGEIGYLVLESGARAAEGKPGWLEERMDLPAFWDEAERLGGPSPAALDRLASLLALGLANICVALDLDLVVVGGAGRDAFGPALLERLKRGLENYCAFGVRCEAPVSQEPGVAGAAGLAMEAWLAKALAG